MNARTAAPLVVFVGLLVLAGPTAASPQPAPVCPVCGTALDEAVDRADVPADDAGRPLNLSVARSEATVRVLPNGTAAWTVENRLANETAAAYLRDHPDVLWDVVAAAFDDASPGRPAPGSTTGVRARVDGRTLVVRYRQTGFAERRPGGVLFSDYFYTSDEGFWFRLTVDRLVVRPPPGHVFTTRPAGADADRDEVVWTRGDRHLALEDAYLATAPGEGAAANLATRAALAGATLPYVAAHLTLPVPGAALFGVLVWGLGRHGRPAGHRRGLARLLTAGGVLLALHPLYARWVPLLGGTNDLLLALAAVYAVAGVIAGWTDWLDGAPVARLLAVPVAATLAVAVGGFLVSPVGTAPPSDLWHSVLAVAGVLPAGLLLAFGAARGRRGEAAVRRWAAGAAAALFVLPLLSGGLARPLGTFGGLTAVLVVVGAVGSLVGGYPLYRLGLALGTRDGGTTGGAAGDGASGSEASGSEAATGPPDGGDPAPAD